MKYRVLFLLFILFVAVTPVFAQEVMGAGAATSRGLFGGSNIGGYLLGESGEYVINPFGPLISLFQSWLTSFLFGALFAIRFAKDILNAYVNREEHPEAMKQSIVRFAVTVIFVAVIFHMIASGLGGVVRKMLL